MDTREKLSNITVMLHWVIAFAMIAMLAFGLYLEDLPRSPEKGELMGIHKSVGVLILVVAAYRLFHRFVNKMPAPLSPAPQWQLKAAHITHGLLLLGTVLMPISGIMMTIGGGRALEVFGIELLAAGDKVEWLGDLANVMHGFGGSVLIGIIVLHVAAAIKHRVIDKDKTMERMLGQKVE